MNGDITYEQAKAFCKEFQTLVGQTLYCSDGANKDGSLTIKEYPIKEVILTEGQGGYALAVYDATTGETSDAYASIFYHLSEMQELANEGVLWYYGHFPTGTCYEKEWQSTNLYRLKNYLLNKTNMEENRQEQLTVSDAASMPRHNGVYTITPELAAEWLKGNTHNRTPNAGQIAFYARIMAGGAWRENPAEPIAFTPDGRLINGQHRLLAVIKANVPTKMVVTWDAQENDFEIVDTGRNRTTSDVMSIKGVPNSKLASSITKRVMLLSDGWVATDVRVDKRWPQMVHSYAAATRQKYTTEDVLAFYYAHADIIQDAANRAQRMVRNYVRILGAPDMAAYIVFLQISKGHSLETVTAFFEALLTGDTRYPYLQDLQRRLNDAIMALHRLTGYERQQLIAMAWNMYLAGSNATKIRRIKDGVKIGFN